MPEIKERRGECPTCFLMFTVALPRMRAANSRFSCGKCGTSIVVAIMPRADAGREEAAREPDLDVDLPVEPPRSVYADAEVVLSGCPEEAREIVRQTWRSARDLTLSKTPDEIEEGPR